MTMAAVKQDKVLNFSSEREQSGACSSSAEREKNQGKNFLNVPNKRVQSQACLSSAERAGLRTKGNVPTLRFPEFTEEWAALSIEDCLIRLENGANYDTNDVEGYPMSRIETISTSRIDYLKVGHSANLKNAEHYRMLYGDILFSHINSVRHIGKTAYYEAEKPLYHGMNLLLLRCKSEIDSKYIYYILNSQKFLRKCQVLAKQAVNQASISTSDLRKIRLFVPQHVEQEKIAKFLSCIDNRINTQIRIINKLKSLMRGLNNKLMNNPKWDKVYVGDFMEFYSTNSLSWEQLNYDDGQVRNLHYGLIHSGLPTLVDCHKISLPCIQDASLPKQYVICKDGDVAFADASEDTAEVGKAVELTNIGTQTIACGLHTIHGRDVKSLLYQY